MELKFIYKGEDFEYLKNDVASAYKEIGGYFQNAPKNITVRVHKTKKDFNKQLRRNTQDWEIANASYDNEIDILHPAAFEKESSHRKEEFLPVLKHEIIHLFTDELAKESAVPKWLNEDFSSFISGQYKNIKKQRIYIEQNFCEKLGTPKEWNEHSNYNAYQISALFIQFLIENNSLDKLKQLISSLDKNYYYPNFQKIFQEIFNKDIEDAEKEFVAQING